MRGLAEDMSALSAVNRRFSRNTRVLAGITVVAVVLRLVVAFSLGDQIVALPGIQDQISYDTLAHRVLAGYGFTFPTEWWPVTRAGEPTAHWSFLYVLYLTGSYGVFGSHPLVARLAQAVAAGVLTPLLAWRIGQRVLRGIRGKTDLKVELAKEGAQA